MSGGGPPPVVDVVVFAALAWERRAVVAALGDTTADRAGMWRGRLGDGGTCLVVQTGIGPARAARAAAAAPPARAFVTAGCAGALAASLAAGDLVAADAVIALDPSGRAGERLPAAGEALAAWAAARGACVHRGTIASSPTLLGAPDEKRAAAATGALVVEMESAAVAREARVRGIPHVGLRVVLDAAEESVPLDASLLDAAGNVSVGRALVHLLHPRTWPAVLRLARARRLAERRLRALLRLVLAEGGMAPLTRADSTAPSSTDRAGSGPANG